MGALLSSVSLFSGLSEDELGLISQAGRYKRYLRSEIIFYEGEEARYLYVLLKGRIKIFKVSFEGKEQILHTVEPGEPFGEVPMFSGAIYPANAMPMEDSKVFYLAKEDFLSIIKASPDVAMHMIGFLSRRLRQFARLVEEISLKEVPGRLASYLLFLMERGGNSKQFKLDMSKNQLASILGTVPETLSRAFSRLKGLGVIDMEGSSVCVMNEAALREMAITGKE